MKAAAAEFEAHKQYHAVSASEARRKLQHNTLGHALQNKV